MANAERSSRRRPSVASRPPISTGYPALQTTLSLLAAGLLFVGPFAPIVHVPLLGDLNYFGDGRRDGIFMLGVAAIAAAVCVARWFKVQTGLGIIVLAWLAWFIHEFMSRVDEAQRSASAQLAGNPFADAASAIISSVQIQWGAALLALGGILLVVVGVVDTIRESRSPQPTIR